MPIGVIIDQVHRRLQQDAGGDNRHCEGRVRGPFPKAEEDAQTTGGHGDHQGKGSQRVNEPGFVRGRMQGVRCLFALRARKITALRRGLHMFPAWSIVGRLYRGCGGRMAERMARGEHRQGVRKALVTAAALLALCQPAFSAAAETALRPRLQAGLIANDSRSQNVFPSGFLAFDEGFNLNRAELILERVPRSNLKARVGPLPGPAPVQADWGFEVDLRYGTDAAVTFGLDDDLSVNAGNDTLWLLPQWFASAYLPWGKGVTVIAGSFFTPAGYEIGAPLDPPTGFYSHSYAFAYQPIKHVGVHGAARLPLAEETGHWSLGVGIVQGWNNLEDNNDDKTLLLDLRWRSRDYRSWVDLETVIGNEQSEGGVTEQTRPFNAVSSRGEKLLRNFHSLTLSHRLDARHRWALNAIYAHQEGGDVEADENNPPGFLITEDSAWYGVNGNWYYRPVPALQAALRVEWFRDEKGAHALLPRGTYRGVTANLAWWPAPDLRLRAEVRRDAYSGPGQPFGGEVPTVFFGDRKDQWIFSLDLTWSPERLYSGG